MLPRISEFFSWCGRNSMIILAFHCLEMRFFNWDQYIYPYIPFEMNWFSMFVVDTVFILVASWLYVKAKEAVKQLDDETEFENGQTLKEYIM